MAKRTIRTLGDDVLRKKCKEVTEIRPALLTLLDDMTETMYAANGVGLAAPQVGILKRVVVLDVGQGLVELINPVIVEKRGAVKDEEGCLSLPGKSAVVERPEYTVVKALDRKGREFTIEGDGLLSRCLNHEIDHLDGILYIDKAVKN